MDETWDLQADLKQEKLECYLRDEGYWLEMAKKFCYGGVIECNYEEEYE